MLIGMGGGAASSMATGVNTADLDFDSVQRGNAEIERRAPGSDRPLLAARRRQSDPVDPRRRRGRPVQRAAGARAWRRCRRYVRPARDSVGRARHDAARDLVQRGAGALRAGDRAGDRCRCSTRCARASAARSRWSAPRTPKDAWSSRIATSATSRWTCRSTCILGKPPKMTRDVRHVVRTLPALDLAGIDVREAAYRVLQLPGGRGQDVPRHDRRSHGGRTLLARPDGRSVAGAGGRRRGHADGLRWLRRRGDGDGRAHAARADRRAGIGTHGGGRGDHQYRGGAASRRSATSSCRRTGWRRPDIPARTPRCTTRCAPSRSRPVRASASRIPVGKDSMSMRTTWTDGGVAKAVTAPVSLIVSAFAPVRDVRTHLDAAAAVRSRRDDTGADRPRRWTAPSRRLGAGAGVRAAR